MLRGACHIKRPVERAADAREHLDVFGAVPQPACTEYELVFGHWPKPRCGAAVRDSSTVRDTSVLLFERPQQKSRRRGHNLRAVNGFGYPAAVRVPTRRSGFSADCPPPRLYAG